MAAKEIPKLNITFFGPLYVGKTTLINRIVSNFFVRHYYPTSGVVKYNFQMDLGDQGDKEESKYKGDLNQFGYFNMIHSFGYLHFFMTINII